MASEQKCQSGVDVLDFHKIADCNKLFSRSQKCDLDLVRSRSLELKWRYLNCLDGVQWAPIPVDFYKTFANFDALCGHVDKTAEKTYSSRAISWYTWFSLIYLTHTLIYRTMVRWPQTSTSVPFRVEASRFNYSQVPQPTVEAARGLRKLTSTSSK